MIGNLYHRIIWQAGLACISLLIFVACQSSSLPAVTYSDLCGSPREQFGKLDEQSILQWIKSKGFQSFQAPAPELPAEMATDHIQAFGWIQSPDSQTIGVAYLRNGQLARVSIQDLQNGPTFGQVVAGLGTPDTLYRSRLEYEQVLYTVGLEYSAPGVIVYTSGIENRGALMRNNQLSIRPVSTSRVSRTECFEPQSAQSALKQVFFLPDASIPLEMQRRIAWPGFDTWVPF